MSDAARPVVYVHIGAPKTGTTYLQRILRENRFALREAGLLYPSVSHFYASQDLREMQFRHHANPRVPGTWGKLVAEVQRWRGNAVIDHELLAAATQQHIDRARNDLRFADVHIVWTDRDLARQLPAAWQESIKNEGTITFADFLEAVRGTGGRQRRAFWSLHDAPAILARWSSGLPPEHVHVVTVPPSGADIGVLWRRFGQVLGIEPDQYWTDVPTTNASLGAAEATVIRRMNEQLGEVPWPRYARLVKHQLTDALADRCSARIELPQDAFDWAVEQGQRMVDALTVAGYDVVGDLAELLPAVRPTGVNPDEAPAQDQAAAAIAGLTAFVEGFDQRTETELRRLRARVDRAERRLAQWEGLSPAQLVKRAAVARARRVSWLRALHHRYRTLRHR